MKKTDEKKDPLILPDNARVTVTKMGHITEIKYLEKRNSRQTIKKIDKDRYADLSTGEIKEFKHTENRSENINSLNKTFAKMRYLINHNFTGESNELFLTLTYAENMTDTKRLYTDTDKFMKRLRYKFNTKTSIDYMTVVEPQERGAWHLHILLRFNDISKIYIPNNELSETWGHGFVRVNKLKGVDNIGAYLTAYLTDLEFTDETIMETLVNSESGKISVVDKEINGESKKIIKGGRLHRYPTNMNYYRSSRGVKMPARELTSYKKAKKIVGSAKPHYTRTIEYETDTFSNVIYTEQYNSKRKNRQ